MSVPLQMLPFQHSQAHLQQMQQVSHSQAHHLQMQQVPLSPQTRDKEAIVSLIILNEKIEHADKEVIYFRVAYHYIYTRYWVLSLIVIILSSILTIAESIKTVFIETKNNSDYSNMNVTKYIEQIDNRMTDNIKKHSLDWNFACDILALITGAIITIIMSIIRFNKYNSSMEILSNHLTQILNYKDNITNIKYRFLRNEENLDVLETEFIRLEESSKSNSELAKILSKNTENRLRNYSLKIRDKYNSNCLLEYFTYCSIYIPTIPTNSNNQQNGNT